MSFGTSALGQGHLFGSFEKEGKAMMAIVEDFKEQVTVELGRKIDRFQDKVLNEVDKAPVHLLNSEPEKYNEWWIKVDVGIDSSSRIGGI